MGDAVTTLEAISISHGFGDGALRTEVLTDISLTVSQGKVSLLIGPSGSGKSTLVAILSGLLRPNSGKVIALGEDIWKLSDRRREEFRRKYCGFIFQGYNLFPALTARQQLELVLKWGMNKGSREATEVADTTLASLGLADKTRLRPQQLSGGEKQRVAVGRALVKGPKLIFADEPTAALDWHHGEQVVQMLREAAKERDATVVLVSHDPRIIPFADQVYHLDDGRIVEEPIRKSA